MVESIPLIQALLSAMGVTAAGATGNKIKLSAEDQAALAKYAKGAAKVSMGLTGGPTTSLLSTIEKPLMVASGVADMVHTMKNGAFEGPSNTPSKKEDNTPDNKNNGDNNPPPPPVLKKKKPNWKEMTYEERMAQAQEDLQNSHLSSSEAEKALRQAESKQRLRDAANNGWEALDETQMIDYKGPKNQGMSSQEAVNISRENYLNGKPNSVDIDKLASEYKGYQKSKLNGKTVEQNSSDIMEYKRPLEKLRMLKPAAKPEDILKFLGKNLSVMGILIKTLGADETEAAEYEERYDEIADAFMHAETLEDVKIANQMAKDFEKEVGPKAMNAIKDKVMGSFNKEDKEEE